MPEGDIAFFEGSRVRNGKELNIADPKLFSYRWMRPLEAFPKDWKPTKAMCKVKGDFALENQEQALKEATKAENEERRARAKADSDDVS